MPEVPSLKPEDIANIATFFGNGYIFRAAMLSVRSGRNEPDLHAVTLSVLTSVVLWVPYSIVNWRIPDSIRQSYHLPISVASFLIASYALGLSWGYAPRLFARARRPWIRHLLGSQEAQSVRRFLLQSRGKWIRVRLDNGFWYEGMVDHFDRDAERFRDLHITLVHPAISKGGDDPWLPLADVERILICISDVKAAHILRPPELAAPVES